MPKLITQIESVSFQDIILKSHIYIDKTSFIEEVIYSSMTAILITRPSGWGKSLNLDMLKTFLSIDHENNNNLDNKLLFQGGIVNNNGTQKILKKLKIAEDCPECLNKQGRYPVIFLDFKDMVYGDAKLVANSIKIALIKNYMQNNLNPLDTSQHKFTIDSIISYHNQILSDHDQALNDINGLIKRNIKQINNITSSQNLNLDLAKLNELKEQQSSLERQQSSLERQQFSLERQQSSLERQQSSSEDKFDACPIAYIQGMVKDLCEILYKKYGEYVYILIDEYDKPVNHFFEEGLEDNLKNRLEVTDLIYAFMSAAGKSNNYLKTIILTGTFNTLTKSGNSGFNNVQTFGIIDARFTRSFGFSEDEVISAIDSFNFENASHILAMTRKWYNGYDIPLNSRSSIPIYSPLSVMNYFSNCQYNELFEPEIYWSENNAANIIYHLFDERFFNISSKFIQKISRITVYKKEYFDLCRSTSLAQVAPFNYQDNEEIVTYMLVNSGYMSVIDSGNSFSFRIPNAEVSKKYAMIIKDKISEVKESELLKFFGLWHTRLTYNPKTLDIVKAIVSNSVEELNEILKNEPDLKCNNKNLKFNFFHLAAISGDLKIFNKLLLHCNDESILSDKDNIDLGLTALDYARLSNNKEIELFLENQGYTPTKMTNPTIFEFSLCHQYSPILTLSSISIITVIKSLPKISDYFSYMNQKTITGLIMLADILNMVTDFSKNTFKHIGSNICSNYNSYSSIKDNTLEGFVKSITENPNLYYLNIEDNCHNDIVSKNTIVKYLESDYSEGITFTLCQINIVGEDHALVDKADYL